MEMEACGLIAQLVVHNYGDGIPDCGFEYGTWPCSCDRIRVSVFHEWMSLEL